MVTAIFRAKVTEPSLFVSLYHDFAVRLGAHGMAALSSRLPYYGGASVVGQGYGHYDSAEAVLGDDSGTDQGRMEGVGVHKQRTTSTPDLAIASFSITRVRDALTLPVSSPERWDKLASLAREFQETASHYGKTIIEEIHFPEEQRTVKTICVGGLAGGSKFLVRDVLFKFASPSVAGVRLYPTEEEAHKIASHELRAAVALWGAVLGAGGGGGGGGGDAEAVPPVLPPLMCVIRHRGYCILASSLLPLRLAAPSGATVAPRSSP